MAVSLDSYSLCQSLCKVYTFQYLAGLFKCTVPEHTHANYQTGKKCLYFFHFIRSMRNTFAAIYQSVQNPGELAVLAIEIITGKEETKLQAPIRASGWRHLLETWR